MIREDPSPQRSLKTEHIECDLVVIGGGLAGACCAVTAARSGIRVTLVQDRPVLGGNASSEVRLWILGATSHLGNNNRWAREGGVIDELLVENMYRNPEGNPVFLDALLLEMVTAESNIRLLLNTSVYSLEKHEPDTIRSVSAFCAQNSTLFEIAAPVFCDASGDGIAAFLAGAAFRMGAEAASEFGEKFAPPVETMELLGHSIYFYSKDVGRPVKFVPPSYALTDITRIPRFRDFNARDSGCKLWWIEWGGNLDTVHDTETIKWELWKVVFGVWHHIKNSGRFSEAANLTLEWVGTVPGKRESRRFEGDYILTQQDVVEQRQHADAVSFGGWAIDLHPSDGVFSEKPGCTQWHSRGVYQIPYRCLYSRNISNLFLAGRIISVSHIAYGSTRVMATCAHGGQAVGAAAALCIRRGLRPRDLAGGDHLTALQQDLLRAGQYIPHLNLRDEDDLARSAMLTVSSELRLAGFTPNGETRRLDDAVAMLLPVSAGKMPRVTVWIDVAEPTELRIELRTSERPGNHTPDQIAKKIHLPLEAGDNQPISVDFGIMLDRSQTVFVCLMANADIRVHLSDQRVTGILAVTQKFNRSVAKSPRQEPPEGAGIDRFEFWLPERRPGGKNLALRIEPPLTLFGVANLTNGVARPTIQPNAWVASFDDAGPTLELRWPIPQDIGRIELTFDTDYDHPMESVLMGHPERVMPFCIQSFEVRSADNVLLHRCEENHRSRRSIRLSEVTRTSALRFLFVRGQSEIPIALFEARCYPV